MGRTVRLRPVDTRSPSPDAAARHPLKAAPAGTPRTWPEGSLELAEQLQRRLCIGERDWHALKGQRPRRGAEQIAAALVHLLAADDPARRSATPARERAIALLEHGLAWMRAEISDPGCPDHGR
jgi:hypothetical protein